MRTQNLFETHYFWFTQESFYAEKKAADTFADKEGTGNEPSKEPDAKDNPNTLESRKLPEAAGQDDQAERLLETDRYRLLYEYAFAPCPKDTDVTGRFLLQAASAFTTALLRQPDIELLRENITICPDEEQITSLLSAVPFANGSEYVTEDWIRQLFSQLNRVFCEDIRDYNGTVSFYLAEKSQTLSLPERVFFHLVESGEEDYPFAFLATYGTKSENNRIKHVPLKYALTEYEHSNEKLLELLSCLNHVGEISPLLGGFIERGELFHPLRLKAEEAYDILREVPRIEEAGIICRVPNWWKRNAANVSVSVRLGEERPMYLGLDTILTMQPSLMVDGVMLTREEITRLLKESEGLAYLKGKWVVVDHDRLRQLLDALDSYRGEITLLEALRGGLSLEGDMEKVSADVGPIMTNGAWLGRLLSDIRTPSNLKKTKPPKTVKATLRPYQQEGYEWLRYMEHLGLGACLADDMGLGKTLQVLTFLESIRRRDKQARVLLVVPASLIGNWQREAEKFTPSMPLTILHGKSGAQISDELTDSGRLPFLCITTYGMLVRIERLRELSWDCLILDEAQAIKNPTTKQTRYIKQIPARMKIAMTGTPIENDLTNLWSLFDFLDKGLLGSSNEFKEYTKKLPEHPEGYAKLKNMITPFMLRRLKTDKKIISDLPDKVENIDYVIPSKKQTVLYRKYVSDLAVRLAEAEGMERRGLVLAALTKLKQICNHPDQYVGQESYEPKESGKFEMLRELCTTIAQKRERVLVFTQFKEITSFLDDFLAEVFGRRGFVLHGSVTVKRRSEMVETFQGEKYIPYMVISVKAGGTGLNLTNANHVIHFDRWWNPAVENQATDRAFRIGQKKKVIVHKLVCKGTIEEKIDQMLRDKQQLAENVVGSSGENWITEMSNEELLSMMSLDA